VSTGQGESECSEAPARRSCRKCNSRQGVAASVPELVPDLAKETEPRSVDRRSGAPRNPAIVVVFSEHRDERVTIGERSWMEITRPSRASPSLEPPGGL